MFKKLTQLGHQRTKKQAVGFYIAYFFLTVVSAAILAATITMVGLTDDPAAAGDLAIKIGAIVAVIVSIVISILILKEKNLLNHLGFIMLVLVSGLLAAFVGALGGLLIPAYLSTRPTRKGLEITE